MAPSVSPPPEFFRPPELPQIPSPPSKPSRGRSRKGAHKSEGMYRGQLARTLSGVTEVTTPTGRVDIVTRTEIIEVEAAARWKHALGQILAYCYYYPSHQKRIHLYREVDPTVLDQICTQCWRNGVRVTWQA